MSSLVQWDGSSTPTRGEARTPARATEPEPVRAVSYGQNSTPFEGWADLPDRPEPPAGTAWNFARGHTVRSGAAYVQRLRGWALGTQALAIRDYARPLSPRPDGRLQPAGAWVLRAAQTIGVQGLVRLRPAGAGGGTAQGDEARVESTDRVVETLPSSVRRLLDEAGGEVVTHALLWQDKGIERVWALAIGESIVVAIRAERRWARRPVGPWDLAVWRAERTNPAAAQIDAGRTKQLER